MPRLQMSITSLNCSPELTHGTGSARFLSSSFCTFTLKLHVGLHHLPSCRSESPNCRGSLLQCSSLIRHLLYNVFDLDHSQSKNVTMSVSQTVQMECALHRTGLHWTACNLTYLTWPQSDTVTESPFGPRGKSHMLLHLCGLFADRVGLETEISRSLCIKSK
jgi:hypothetical protein